MVLEKVGVTMSWPLRDRGARNADRAVHLSRRIVWYGHTPKQLGFPVSGCRIEFPRRALLQLDGVALHLIVKGGPLDAEECRCFFLVAATLRERLENGVALDVVESLYAAARQCTELGLLQRRG